MVGVGVRRVLATAIASALIVGSMAFKARDFKTCKDSGFCTRLRSPEVAAPAAEDAVVLTVGSLSVEGGVARFHGHRADAPEHSLTVEVMVYESGTVRVRVTENGVDRFEVPEVLRPSFLASASPWMVESSDGDHVALGFSWTPRFPAGRDGSSASPTPATALRGVAVVRYAPFSVSVGPSAAAAASDLWLTLQHVRWEPRRARRDTDPAEWWSERFEQHEDPLRHGPQALGFDLFVGGATTLSGLPERARALSLPPTREANGTVLTEPYRLYNLDVFEYDPDSPFGLYGSVPFATALRGGAASGPEAVGAFWLNAAEMYVDAWRDASGMGTRWFAEAGVLDLLLFPGPSALETTRQYAVATGPAAAPALFALGYHQSRWNYRDEADVEGVSGGADRAGIPMDVIWLDIEHTDGKRYLTWDAATFPTPARLLREMDRAGRRVVAIVDPHIKKDPGYSVYSEALARGHFVVTKDDPPAPFEGWCWPGASLYLDVLSPEVRDWWADRFSLQAYAGSAPNLFVWNDMNEPSVFNGPEITMPKHARHVRPGAPADAPADERLVEHRELHNLYGLLYHGATAEGLRRRGEAIDPTRGRRPFVLTRAVFAGSQRVGPVWTGDNAAQWSHLRAALPMVLALNVAGMPFSGADIGGFFGDPDPELLVRWYQAAVWGPFFRAHAHLDSKRREPWLLDEGPELDAIRAAIRRRYRLLPYLYALFRANRRDGVPVLRPLAWEFPRDAHLAAVDGVAMLGGAVLGAPVVDPAATRHAVPLPGREGARQEWYDLDTGVRVDPAARELLLHVSLASSPALLRGGAVLPLWERVRRSTKAMLRDPLTLVVAPDAEGAARGEVYLDDGETFADERLGEYLERVVVADVGATRIELDWAPPEARDGEVDDGEPARAAFVPPVRALPPAREEYDPGVLVDRVVVLGVPRGRWTGRLVRLDGRLRDEEVRVDWEPLLAGTAGPDCLVVQRARLPAASTWTLQLARQGA